MNRTGCSVVVVIVVVVVDMWRRKDFCFPTLSADIILSSLAFWPFVSSHLSFVFID